MTRIIAGTYGGRQIRTPKGDGTRPTSDRVREAMFSSIVSELGSFQDIRVLDLFAGSGALGLESLSRGAAFAHFVESDARAVATIRANIAALGAPATVSRTAVAAFVQHPPDHSVFDLVFIDPPYAMDSRTVAQIVSDLEALAPEALIVVERSTRDPFTWPDRVVGLRHKKYGETTLWYGR